MASRHRPRCATSTPNCASAFADVRASAAYRPGGGNAQKRQAGRNTQGHRRCDLTIATGLGACKAFATRRTLQKQWMCRRTPRRRPRFPANSLRGLPAADLRKCRRSCPLSSRMRTQAQVSDVSCVYIIKGAWRSRPAFRAAGAALFFEAPSRPQTGAVMSTLIDTIALSLTPFSVAQGPRGQAAVGRAARTAARGAG